MFSEDTKILEFHQYWKSDKAPSIINADLECLIEKIDRCKNNPVNLSTRKVDEHILSGFSMSAILMYTEVKIVWKKIVNLQLYSGWVYSELLMNGEGQKCSTL